MKLTGTKCQNCNEMVSEGNCAGCGDRISDHCDACITAMQCQDCGQWFGNLCCMNQDRLGNRCNSCLNAVVDHTGYSNHSQNCYESFHRGAECSCGLINNEE